MELIEFKYFYMGIGDWGLNLRFDDTNPTKENTEYVENIMNDIKWLGFHWENVYYEIGRAHV